MQRCKAVLDRLRVRKVLAVVTLAGFVVGCSSSPPEPVVKSHLSGSISVAAAVDSSGNFEGFSVVVASLGEAGLDTLGIGFTERDGRFAFDIEAPAKGVYPVAIRRHGEIVKQGQVVVADGDSATLSIELPTGRPLTIRSAENGAWMAYRNTKAAHAANVRRMAGTGSLDAEMLSASVHQTANILWNLGETYPGTMGADLGRVESVVMLATWDDSIAVSRLRALPADAPGIVEAVRAGWRSAQRLAGVDSALATIAWFRDRSADPAARAALFAERIVALMDGDRIDEARTAARELASADNGNDVPETWRAWGEAALYEIDTLQPGLQAPDFAAVARDGSRFALSELTSGLVVLEFYTPDSEEYQQELPLRMQFDQIAGPESLQIISVSLEPDADLNDAFIDSRNLPGVHIVAEGGAEGELASLYNVRSVPKRFLIQDGRIVSKYHGRTLGAVVDDARALLNASS